MLTPQVVSSEDADFSSSGLHILITATSYNYKLNCKFAKQNFFMNPKETVIFFVEDDVNLGFVTKDYLESQGFVVIHFADGREALDAVAQTDFHIAVLDIMLPGVDGYEIAAHIRKVKPGTPVIYLTAKTMPEDRIKGLKSGVDDYITKPFLTEELKLRIEAVLRRYFVSAGSGKSRNKLYHRLGKMRFYPDSGVLKKSDADIDLTAKETALLILLFENRNSLVTREEAFEKVWKSDEDPSSRTLDVYIGKLRKILAGEENIHIRSIHGKGYKLEIR